MDNFRACGNPRYPRRNSNYIPSLQKRNLCYGGVDSPPNESALTPSTPSRKPLLAALAGQQPPTPPIWLMRQAGRYLPEYRELRRQAGSFLDLCFAPDLAVEVTLQPLRRFRFDAAILFSDILVVPLALGQSVSFQEGVGPVLDPIRREQDLDRLSAAGLVDRLAPVYEAVRGIRRSLSPEQALIGFAGAPWTVATYMVEGGTSRDHANTRGWAYREPESFARLVDLLVEATVEHLAAQVEAGAEVLQIFDTWAGALSYQGMRTWSLQPITRIAAALKQRHPDVPIIVFPRGVGEAVADFAAVPEIDAVSLDSSAAPRQASRLQATKAVQGNLDPYVLVAGGEIMRHEIDTLLGSLGRGPYVFNLGHGIVPTTPPEHVAELVERVRGWRP